jgi:hypothetical protein
MSGGGNGGDRRASPNQFKMLIQSWPIVATLAGSLIAGLMQWSEVRRDLSVIERRLIDADRRVIALEAADAAHAAAMTDLRLGLARIEGLLNAIKIDIETQPPPRPRRRANLEQ